MTTLSYTVFLTTLLPAAWLSLLKSVGTIFYLSTSILLTLAYNPAKSDFVARLDVLTPAAFFKSFFLLHN